MADRLVDLAEALEAVAEAMDAETEILSLSARADFAARAERKVICIEQAASLMERMPKRAPDVCPSGSGSGRPLRGWRRQAGAMPRPSPGRSKQPAGSLPV
jgi:hypothetical protein